MALFARHFTQITNRAAAAKGGAPIQQYKQTTRNNGAKGKNTLMIPLGCAEVGQMSDFAAHADTTTSGATADFSNVFGGLRHTGAYHTSPTNALKVGHPTKRNATPADVQQPLVIFT